MHIEKLRIENFKCFGSPFTLELNKGLNIIVGDNEAGKSTILEAVHLALSGWIRGRYVATELGESLFNKGVVKGYLASLKTDARLPPPHILIEVFFSIEDDSIQALFEGNYNSTRAKACGIHFKIALNEKFQSEYEMLLNSGEEIHSLPIEYYDFSWASFARDERVTPKTIPFKSALIDSTDSRSQNGSDMYISRIIRDFLPDEHKIKMSQAHRQLRDHFAMAPIIQEVNSNLAQRYISEKRVELSVDLSTKTAWETSLTTSLDGIPFNFAGKGEQCLVKTKLALSHKKAQEACVLLLEEPENHLSHSKLNKLIKDIKANNGEKQIIISTHSSFVANKLGLESLILINTDAHGQRREVRLRDLLPETNQFFEKLSGYDTLRLVLCKKAILVEGPSDELVVQKAYLKIKGRLPIEDEVDVISVGTSFLRFLEIAEKIKKPVAVVTDNDGDFYAKITKKYAMYATSPTIKVYADPREGLPTLEPQIVAANTDRLDLLRDILGLEPAGEYPDETSISDYMKKNKTAVALKLFDTDADVNFPQYILEAIN